MADWEMAVLFFSSIEYKQYLEISQGIAFKEDIFYQAKCKCIKPAEDEECSCPWCTVFREGVRSYHKQRVQWHRKAKAEGKTCGASCSCHDPSFLSMSRSSSTFRAYLHRVCGKVAYPALSIRDGPKAADDAPEFYRRECCRVPLPELKAALPAVLEWDAAVAEASATAPKLKALQENAVKLAGTVGLSVEDVRSCADCTKCGFGASMPRCPIEWEDGSKSASYKTYRPRLAPDGKTIQNELQQIACSRLEFMEHLRESFDVADPHLFIDEWTTHQRQLVYGTLLETELAISTDFSAQYDHKAAWTNTCEHPPRSNMDVFVVTHVKIVEDHRVYFTDVWRIISAAKGSSGFHNTALAQIVTWYRHVMELKVTWLFTDGCRGQYKGKRNFRRISTFAHDHSASAFEVLQPPFLSFSSHDPPSDISNASTIALMRAAEGVAATASSATASVILPGFHPLASQKKPPLGWGTFPIHTVNLRHLFACGHHFKGPHDGYGKDAKHLPRMTEKQQN